MKQNLIVIPSKTDTVDRLHQAIDKCLSKKEAFAVVIKGLSERSLSQNALLHIWFREYAGHLLNKENKHVTHGDIEAMKISAKRRCYATTHWFWLIEEKKDLITKEKSKGLTSSARWSKGQMFNFMEWLQAYATNDGLILEAKGEFEELKKNAENLN